jgi:hypothetical protein
MLPAFILKMNDPGAKTVIIKAIRKIVFDLAGEWCGNILLNRADNGIPTTKLGVQFPANSTLWRCLRGPR